MELHAQCQKDAWAALRAEIRRSVGASTFEVWMSQLAPRSWEDGVLELEGPPDTVAWLGRRYGPVLQRLAAKVAGVDVDVRLVPTDTATAQSPVPGRRAGELGHRPVGAHGATDPSTSDSPRGEFLNPRYSFDQFIIGQANRLAHAAALQVAELPGQAYNPLFLYAPPGLGKTHLLHAIGNYLLAHGGNAKVQYTTVEAFTNHFVRSIGSRTTEAFKREYRGADVLLIDDVQFLASKVKTEEEFFHTFNALYENGRQLVLTCDRLPAQLHGVEKRLRERFEAGLVADIGAPDLPTRLAILRKRAALDGLRAVEPKILEIIAQRVTDNIRTLEGALIRVVAYASLTGQPMDEELTRSVLQASYPGPSPTSPAPHQITIERIQSATCEHYGITLQEMRSKARPTRIVWPRQVAVHLSRELTSGSLPAIGAAFGGRNHATVINSCRRVENRLAEDAGAREDVDNIRRRVLGPQADRNG